MHTERPLDVALDGEIVANLPGDVEAAGEALRVITPRPSRTSTTDPGSCWEAVQANTDTERDVAGAAF